MQRGRVEVRRGESSAGERQIQAISDLEDERIQQARRVDDRRQGYPAGLNREHELVELRQSRQFESIEGRRTYEGSERPGRAGGEDTKGQPGHIQERHTVVAESARISELHHDPSADSGGTEIPIWNGSNANSLSIFRSRCFPTSSSESAARRRGSKN